MFVKKGNIPILFKQIHHQTYGILELFICNNHLRASQSSVTGI